MGVPRETDTCDWCGTGTSSLQIRTGQSFGLCPSCCPDVEEEEVPENAPPCWYHMNEEERNDWHQGLDIEEIMERHNWGVPPTR